MEHHLRRDQVLEAIKKSDKALSASALAKQFHVSRQIICGDVALLRASGHHIIATPRGYIMETQTSGICKTIAVYHEQDEMQDELYTIVDMGGHIVDVIVEHSIYGQIQGVLDLKSRYDVDRFIEKVSKHQAKPLSDLTYGLHLHTITCDDEETYEKIKQILRDKGYLYEK